MLEHYVRDRLVLARLRRNPLKEHIERLVAEMREQGYSSSTIQTYIRVADHFGRWFGKRWRRSRVLGGEAIDAFLHRHLPRCTCPSPSQRDVAMIRPVLLRLIPKRLAVAETPDEMLVLQYLRYLEEMCGAARETLLARARYAREFLAHQRACGADRPCDWSVEQVMQWVMDYFARCKRSSAHTAACSLRNFLRFAHSRGLCDARLVHAVPKIPVWRHEGLPRVMTEDQVLRFITSFDRSYPIGRRDYAMALLMLEMGLRVSEVAALELDDIDWRNGMVAVRSSKGRRVRLLPLTDRIGKAISSYIRQGRPASNDRHVFLRHTLPVGAPAKCTLVRRAVCRAYVRSGFPDNWSGTHILRHTAATRLLHRGVCLKEIADILGHRSIDTSAIYAKVDLPALSAVALPWPEVQP